MNCLLIAATAKEIAPFIEHYRNAPSFRENVQIDIAITGIGLTSTAYHLMKLIHIRRPDLIIQAGVAGSFDKSVAPGAVVLVKQDSIADESVVEMKNLRTLFDLKLVPQNQPPYKKGWLVNPSTELMKKTRLRQVKGISVNQISTSKQMIRFYKETFNPVTESMEGAALHYTCLMENIPFLQLRSISNFIGERNKEKWDMQASILHLNRELIRVAGLL